MFDFQSQIIFPTHAVWAPGPLPPGTQRVKIAAANGDQLHGVHISPRGKGAGAGTLVIGFAGNAWNSEDAAGFLHELYPAADVIVFHYRGYRPSTGTPSAEALIEDAPRVYDFAVSRVQTKRNIAIGLSIGSGIAASLASKRPVDGLILVTPFDSLKTVASDQYPYLPVGMLFRHDIDAGAALKRSKVPTAIVAAGNDTLITPRRTDGLRASVGNLVFDRTIRGAGHNDLYHRSDFQQAMREALDVLTKPTA
jgi:hypothetical protein